MPNTGQVRQNEYPFIFLVYMGLQFITVTNVLTKDVRDGSLIELLYADNLISV